LLHLRSHTQSLLLLSSFFSSLSLSQSVSLSQLSLPHTQASKCLTVQDATQDNRLTHRQTDRQTDRTRQRSRNHFHSIRVPFSLSLSLSLVPSPSRSQEQTEPQEPEEPEAEEEADQAIRTRRQARNHSLALPPTHSLTHSHTESEQASEREAETSESPSTAPCTVAEPSLPSLHVHFSLPLAPGSSDRESDAQPRQATRQDETDVHTHFQQHPHKQERNTQRHRLSCTPLARLLFPVTSAPASHRHALAATLTATPSNQKKSASTQSTTLKEAFC
jgi:hypothetical protein